jgi:LytS/YehU family sensor histidine kinase
VRDEVEYVRACLALEEERWGPHLRVTWHVDAGVLSWPLPPFVVQPLVENALRHGLGSRLEGGHIQITIGLHTTALLITVEDDGPGFRPGWSDGVGLGNLRLRLTTLYGERASLTIDSKPEGARVTVSVNGAMRQ